MIYNYKQRNTLLEMSYKRYDSVNIRGQIIRSLSTSPELLKLFESKSYDQIFWRFDLKRVVASNNFSLLHYLNLIGHEKSILSSMSACMKDDFGKTPLHLSAWYFPEFAKKNSLCASAKDLLNDSALHVLATRGANDLHNLFPKDITQANITGLSPAHYISLTGNHSLLNYKISVLLKDLLNTTPLHLLAYSGNPLFCLNSHAFSLTNSRGLRPVDYFVSHWIEARQDVILNPRPARYRIADKIDNIKSFMHFLFDHDYICSIDFLKKIKDPNSDSLYQLYKNSKPHLLIKALQKKRF